MDRRPGGSDVWRDGAGVLLEGRRHRGELRLDAGQVWREEALGGGARDPAPPRPQLRRILAVVEAVVEDVLDRKSTRLNSSH